MALTPPTNATIIAKRAGFFQPPKRALRIASINIQPRPAHGIKIADVRAILTMMKGESA